ncbi:MULTISPECIES: CPBP family intramembrane glutamic endopeptidase [Bacillaceae]|uniref:CPBP family intramembrane metalloprotease n=1 Tax=Evansella alkalicola TaxID=745819 RepID=A0ABS6JYI9_9BACI|nr:MULTISPECIES: type II CAAX endopeptidase family protein [Bacillaceae]MBU9723668.1 CPBP family intramembrane metalloprotease [Bacillus alkalicola]
MNRRYWLILISFILMQLSPAVVIPLLVELGYSGTEAELAGTTLLICFSIGFFVILFLSVTAKPDHEFIRDRADTSQTVLWIILGFFMAYFAQIIVGLIEMGVFGIEPESENTQFIVELATAVPLLMIVVAVFVPIMEEIVFRMVIFGSLYKRFGFWIAALASGFVFAVVHMDFEHLLRYLVVGVVFAFLYVKTKRIIVPIMAHAGINSFVMIVQVIFGEDLQRIMDQMEDMQSFLYSIIGGYF